jgi:hypothetical protein
MNGREEMNNGAVLCRACAGVSYYHCLLNYDQESIRIANDAISVEGGLWRVSKTVG